MNNPDFGIFTFLDKIILQYMQKNFLLQYLKTKMCSCILRKANMSWWKDVKQNLPDIRYPVSGF